MKSWSYGKAGKLGNRERTILLERKRDDMLRKRKHTTRAPAEGSRRFPRGVMLLWLSLFLAGISVMSAFGQNVSWASPAKYWIIYPEYLSRTELSGTEEIGILGIQIEVPAGLSSTISQVVLSPDTGNTFDATLAANLADVHAYLTAKNANFPGLLAERMTVSPAPVNLE